VSDGEYPAGYGDRGYSYGTPNVNVTMTPPAEPVPTPAWEISNVEAEAALLGGLLIANDMISAVSEKVSQEDFFEPLHGRIYRAIVKLHDKARSANPISLRPIFQNDPDMAQLGGTAYLAQLTGSGAAIIGLVDFAEQVAELSTRRVVASAARDALESLGDLSEDSAVDDVEDIVNTIQDRAHQVLSRTSAIKPRSSSSAIRRIRARTMEIEESGKEVGTLCRSVSDMDKIIGPAEGGTYNVIGGRPGMGKTVLACSMAWGYAANGLPVDYYHAEMTADQMDLRHASDLSHAMRLPIAHAKLRKGDLTSQELRWLDDIEAMAETLPLNFYATKSCNIRKLESMVARSAMRWKQKGRKLGAVFVDYLQKYVVTDHRGRVLPEIEAVPIISKAMVAIGERHDVAVFALSQLSRAVEDRKDKRPQMNDLRQSGNIEQDADSVTMIYRGEVYWAKEKPKKDPLSKEFQDWELEMNALRGTVELIGEKNRHGPPRTRTAKFYGAHQAIRSGDYDETSGDEPILSPELFAQEGEDAPF
jgi:replicative DNA helicase